MGSPHAMREKNYLVFMQLGWSRNVNADVWTLLWDSVHIQHFPRGRESCFYQRLVEFLGVRKLLLGPLSYCTYHVFASFLQGE